MTREEIILAIVAELGEVGPDGAVTLDSFGVINVVEELEARFGIRVKASEVTRERFASVASLAAFIEEKLA